MKAAAWIDRVKEKRGWPTDYRVAKELGFTPNTISNYRARPDSLMDEKIALKVAEALSIDPAGIIIDQVAERSKSPEVRAALHEVANQRLYIMLSRVATELIAGFALPIRQIAALTC